MCVCTHACISVQGRKQLSHCWWWCFVFFFLPYFLISRSLFSFPHLRALTRLVILSHWVCRPWWMEKGGGLAAWVAQPFPAKLAQNTKKLNSHQCPADVVKSLARGTAGLLRFWGLVVGCIAFLDMHLFLNPSFHGIYSQDAIKENILMWKAG